MHLREIEGKSIGEETHPKFDNKVCHFCAGAITFLREDRKITPPYHMRGATAVLLPAKNKIKTVYPITDSWVASLTPKKRGNNRIGEEEQMMKEHADPIVAFSKPPPVPPVLGPLIVLSLFQAWTSRDSED